jgi:sulfide:quinone oxidoreductase
MRTDSEKRVLIAGGGVAALEAALALRELAPERVAVELLAPHETFTYEPMSVAEPFGLGNAMRLDLDEIAGRIGAHRTKAGLTGIDAWRQIAHTTRNTQIPYDILLVACGALPLPAVPGATTFRGAPDTDKIGQLLEEVAAGEVRSVAFVIPWGAVWSLPAYELALLTATHVREQGIRDVTLTLVTPEVEPLQVFGPPASAAMRELLDSRGVALHLGAYACGFAHGVLELVPEAALGFDRVIALPRLEGAPLDGIPQTLAGFISVDAHCRVHGFETVFAAGDITSFPVKQGGIAAQQADAAAEAIAVSLGVDVELHPFRPVLRGLLLTGREPRYLRRELTGRPEHDPVAAYEPLWWPPAKIVGRHLAPFLATIAGVDGPAVGPEVPEAISVEVELEPGTLAASAAPRPYLDDLGPDEVEIAEVMAEPVVVAPDVTLSEVAAELVASGGTAAAVCEDGRLVGVLTASDLVRASAARVQPRETRARVWMTAEPVTVSPTFPVSRAAILMAEYRIHHLLVLDDEQVVGVAGIEALHKAVPGAYGTSSTANATSST